MLLLAISQLGPTSKHLLTTKIDATQKLKFDFDFAHVQTTLRKGENVGFHHFLLFTRCFQKANSSLPHGIAGQWFSGNRILARSAFNPLPKQALVFTCLQYKSFKNTVGKGEIARNEQFLHFRQSFLLV